MGEGELTREMIAHVQFMMHNFRLFPDFKTRLERIETYLIARFNRG